MSFHQEKPVKSFDPEKHEENSDAIPSCGSDIKWGAQTEPVSDTNSADRHAGLSNNSGPGTYISVFGTVCSLDDDDDEQTDLRFAKLEVKFPEAAEDSSPKASEPQEEVVLRKTKMPAQDNINMKTKNTPASDKSEKLCGWLNKLGTRAIVKTFKSRWFVYGDNTCKLYYYRTPQDLLHLGEINIHNASFSFDISDTERPGLFEISSEGRSYVLDARNRETMMYWLQELQNKRREFSDRRTSLSKSRITLLQANQKSIDEGLLARQKSLTNGENIDENVDNNNTGQNSQVTSSDLLIGENSAGMPPNNTSLTNFSLANFRTEIRNYVAGLRSPNREMYAVYDKSQDDEWSIINSGSFTSSPTQPKPSPVTTQTPTPGGATRPTGFDKKFSFSNLKKILKKGNGEDMDITPPWGNTLEPCQQCGQLKTYMTSLKEELTSVEEELQANREVTKLLQKEIDKLQSQVRSRNEVNTLNGDSTEALFKQRDDKIVDLEYLLAKTQEEKEMIRQQIRDQGDSIGTLKDQVSMYQEMLTAKDDVIMNLTNQVYDLERGQGSNSDQSNLPVSPPILRVFTDATEVERLKDSCQAYQMQNKFLSKEILELNQLRQNDERRESLLQMQYANMEAKFYQTRSKYLFLLNELKTPVRGGEEGRSQEVIDQLLSDALNSEDDPRQDDLLNSQNSTIEYDRYGFLRQHDTDEDVLVTRATELQRRSKELEMQIKEVDQPGGISHQVKWENFMVSLGEKPVQRSPELKALVRGGIPHQFREPIWKGCINLHLPSKAHNHYQDLVRSSRKNRHNPAAKQVELDLLRTLPTNKYYESMDCDGIAKLRRVLLAYSWHNPDIGYCQGLNRLAAIALLFLSEEDAFWCLVAIVEVIMPQEYYTRTLMAAQADQRVLKDLLQDKLPRLHAHVEQHDVDLSLFTFNWFLTIFVDNITPETFLRVWDVFLYEGSKVLFRFALAFFKYKEEEILQLNTAININKYLRVLGGKMTDIRRLSEIAFHELNPFPRRVVTARRHAHLVQVKAELRELDAIREDFRSQNIPADRVEYYSDDELETEDEGKPVTPTQVTLE